MVLNRFQNFQSTLVWQNKPTPTNPTPSCKPSTSFSSGLLIAAGSAPGPDKPLLTMIHPSCVGPGWQSQIARWTGGPLPRADRAWTVQKNTQTVRFPALASPFMADSKKVTALRSGSLIFGNTSWQHGQPQRRRFSVKQGFMTMTPNKLPSECPFMRSHFRSASCHPVAVLL